MCKTSPIDLFPEKEKEKEKENRKKKSNKNYENNGVDLYYNVWTYERKFCSIKIK